MTVPPQSLEAEAAVLGGILLDAHALDRVLDLVSAEDFYREAHRKIFDGALALHRRSEPVDLVTLTEALQARGELAAAGGAAYLSDLVARAVTSANTPHYARIVREKALRRRLAALARELATAAHESQDDVRELVERTERALLEVTERGSSSAGPIRVGDTEADYFRALEQRQQARGSITGLATGLVDLDRLLGGFQPANLIVVAARPGHGKSGLAVSVAEHVAARSPDPRGVLLFSLEMSFEEIRDRLYSVGSGVELWRLRYGRLLAGDFPRLAGASGRLGSAPVFVDDSAALTPLELRARARRIARDRDANLGLVIVDYVQLMRSPTKGRTREQEVAEMSRSLKALAKELRLPVLALAQLNRDCEARTPPTPRIQDLRESGQLEQDADVIGLLYRADAYQPDRSKHTGRVELLVAKHRNGPIGKIELHFAAETTRFQNLERGNGAAEGELHA